MRTGGTCNCACLRRRPPFLFDTRHFSCPRARRAIDDESQPQQTCGKNPDQSDSENFVRRNDAQGAPRAGCPAIGRFAAAFGPSRAAGSQGRERRGIRKYNEKIRGLCRPRAAAGGRADCLLNSRAEIRRAIAVCCGRVRKHNGVKEYGKLPMERAAPGPTRRSRIQGVSPMPVRIWGSASALVRLEPAAHPGPVKF